jgi:hypothetical protein
VRADADTGRVTTAEDFPRKRFPFPAHGRWAIKQLIDTVGVLNERRWGRSDRSADQR